jgi:hypothetical protein
MEVKKSPSLEGMRDDAYLLGIAAGRVTKEEYREEQVLEGLRGMFFKKDPARFESAARNPAASFAGS